MTVSENDVIAEGTYEVPSLAGLAGIGGTFGLGAPPPPVKYRITYKGTISGTTVRGTVYRRPEGEDSKPKSLLETFDDQQVVLMVLSEDETELKVMERVKKGDTRFYSLHSADRSNLI
jgi:hypothetical protein